MRVMRERFVWTAEWLKEKTFVLPVLFGNDLLITSCNSHDLSITQMYVNVNMRKCSHCSHIGACGGQSRQSINQQHLLTKCLTCDLKLHVQSYFILQQSAFLCFLMNLQNSRCFLCFLLVTTFSKCYMLSQVYWSIIWVSCSCYPVSIQPINYLCFHNLIH